ncbi:M20/M25/M40 family metallo-hydrolase [Neoroseomonas oryzicola]|uniref:M20/M25/M40 family metallo-hydrolase n=1 Tax=Neoroseomonas oryzicola TaxID=535904 RepID=A0A9X9WMP3_9PROT|nr:M20/M25/M40 family metallo-hydrolase [Neoroseomonas oryzicola]MBR0661603.1 M20/M25/M40 family metallo-hydrolase [Neoroseomonas oryzicola]NKE15833.1 M20/M25/M40 family metallo-hydrolase [Neoroseomonas oryzicola]
MTAAESIAAIRADARFAKATETLAAEHDRTVQDLITLTEIPAPPFNEEKRAAAYLEMLRAHGLEEVEQDEIGNVMGIRRGFGNGDMLVVAAHLDTVFPAGTDVRVKREGTKLMAPGIGDDTWSLAVNLAYLRALDAAGIRTRHDILFVGDVGEEGLGDLRGVRHLFDKGRHRGRIRAFLTVDSPQVEQIVSGGVGSRRYRVTFRGPGGHSYAAFGLVNPMYAMAECARGLAAVQVPQSPPTTHCVSVVSGGTSINAIANAVTIEVDLRSASAAELEKLDRRFLQIVDEAVATENAARSTRAGVITAELARVGDRPAGETPAGAPIRDIAAAAVAAEGYKPHFEFSSTDANVPMSLGIPALKIGAGGRGGRAHSLDEWLDVEPTEVLRGMRTSLATILAVAGMEGIPG